MMITYQEVLAFVAGVGFTVLGVWSAAVADRIRGRDRGPSREVASREPSSPTPPRMPQRRASHRATKPRASSPSSSDDVAAWLEGLGWTRPEARAAARHAAVALPNGTTEERIALAMRGEPN